MPASSVPLIAFLSDYGLRDPFVGLCHAAIAAQAPHARVIDLTHDIAPQSVREGAAVLADCLPYLPPAVVLAVVDPGVGTARRGVILAAGTAPGRRLLVGPDNGLLVPAAEALGGVDAAWEIDARAAAIEREAAPLRSRTFDGRDVFAPAAARLAGGAHPGELGEPVDPGTLVRAEPVTGAFEVGVLRSGVLRCDHFGNVLLAAPAAELELAGWTVGQPLAVVVGGTAHEARYGETFADVAVGELAVLADAFGRTQIARRDGDAADLLGAAAEMIVEIAGRDAR